MVWFILRVFYYYYYTSIESSLRNPITKDSIPILHDYQCYYYVSPPSVPLVTCLFLFLPAHRYIEENRPQNGPPKDLPDVYTFWLHVVETLFLHKCGRSFDEFSRARGLVLQVDNVHYNDRSSDIFISLLKDWLQLSVLAPLHGKEPGNFEEKTYLLVGPWIQRGYDSKIIEKEDIFI